MTNHDHSFCGRNINYSLTSVIDINDSHDAFEQEKKKVTKARCIKWIIWKLTFLGKLLENILCSIIYGQVCRFSLVGLIHFVVIV